LLALDEPIDSLDFQMYLNVKDFGAIGNGIADDTAAINSVVSQGKSVYFPAGTYRVNDGGIALQSNCSYWGDGRNTVISLYERATPSTVGIAFYAWDKSNIRVSGMRFTAVSANAMTIAYSGGLNFYNSRNCRVSQCFFDNFFGFGIWIYGGTEAAKSQSIKIKECTFEDWIPSTGGAFGAIHLGHYSADCSVVNNTILCESAFGVACYDGYYAGESTEHKILDNTIKNQASYGIVCYSGKPAEIHAQHLISRNKISNIKGSIESGGVRSFGAGIYCVGCSDLTVTENIVSGCNQQTNDDSLAPGGIGISNCYGDVIVSNNRCFENGWNGIRVTSNYLVDNRKGRYEIVGNICSNNAKAAYQLDTLRNVDLANNTAYNDTQVSAPLVFFRVVNESNISGNNFKDVSGNTVGSVALTDSESTKFAENTVWSASANSYARFHRLNKCGITGNNFTSGNTADIEMVYFQDVTNSWAQGNRVFSPNSTKDVSFYNNCTGFTIDADNKWSAARITNAATGLVLESSSAGGSGGTGGSGAPSGSVVCIQISNDGTYVFSGRDLPGGKVTKSYSPSFNPKGWWPPSLGVVYTQLPEEGDTEVFLVS
jgi:hypothetical protein